MNNKLKSILTKTLLQLCVKDADLNIYKYIKESGNQEIIGSISHLEQIDEIISLGISPLDSVDEGYVGNFLILSIIKNTHSSKLHEYLVSKLTVEEVTNIDISLVKNIYNLSRKNNKILEILFQKNFDFQQETFSETNNLMEYNKDFFEICSKYKKDFDFDFKYFNKQKTVFELLEDEISYCMNDSLDQKKAIDMHKFLLNLKLKKELTSELKSNGNIAKFKI